MTNNVDSIHGITQGMIVDQKIGTEHHLQAPAGSKKAFSVDGLLINTSLPDTFTKEVAKGQPYPFAMRMVSYQSLTEKQLDPNGGFQSKSPAHVIYIFFSLE